MSAGPPPTAHSRGAHDWTERLGKRVREAVAWTPPTSTEIGTVAKSGLAAGLSWYLARLVTDAPAPVLAPLTAIVVIQVSVRASVRTALQRTAAVVLGVLVALAIGDLFQLSGIVVAAIVALSLGVSQLVLRLPAAAARQVPISILVVLAAVNVSHESGSWHRAVDTLLGGAVGVAVSLVLPASRLVDARQTLDRLATSLAGVLEAMGSGLHEPWTTEQTQAWRREARTTRERLVPQAAEAVGHGREAARWNHRDRRHIDVLGRYEEVMPRLERTAIGVSVVARGLDDHARLAGPTAPAMPAMGALLVALADAVRALVRDLLAGPGDEQLARSLAEVRERRQRCVRGATRRARLALERDVETGTEDQLEGEWLSYAALLVQVDRIVGDLSAPLPA